MRKASLFFSLYSCSLAFDLQYVMIHHKNRGGNFVCWRGGSKGKNAYFCKLL